MDPIDGRVICGGDQNIWLSTVIIRDVLGKKFVISWVLSTGRVKIWIQN